MSEKENDNVRDINTGRPFAKAAQEYFDKGWFPIPIPFKEKHPPEKGYTGRHPQKIDQKKLDSWLGRGRDGRLKCNIGLHMRITKVDGKKYYIVGIDVDDYSSGEKEKHGATQLAELEHDLGALPPTYISTSRLDGVSGIRFYRVPVPDGGYSFMGQVAKDIEMLQTSHRYAMVWPSLHPEGREYRWTSSYPINGTRNGEEISFNTERNEDTYDHIEHAIPDARKLPLLPKKWIEHLTQGFQPWSDTDIDMGPNPEEMDAWAEEMFSPGKKMCAKMREKVEYWKKQIDEEATSHDKILGMHWNVLRVASPLEQGHTGWHTAVKELEAHWIQSVGSQGKRTLEEIRGERFRSETNGLRKIKAEMDNAAKDGKVLVAGKVCQCDQQKNPANAKGCDAYTMDDDGNAEHLIDLYPGKLVYVSAFKRWIYWDGKKWTPDKDGIARRKFMKVKKRQQKYCHKLLGDTAKIIAAGDEKESARAKSDLREWKAHAKRSGLVTGATSALESARNLRGVTLPADIWDNQENLLGMKNGVLELRPDGVETRPTRKEDYITHSTGLEYLSYPEHAGTAGYLLWNEYLDTFFPAKNAKGKSLRRFMQKVLGYCLLSGNPERLTLFFRGLSGGGKSTMLAALKAALGDYSSTVSSGIFGSKFENPEMVQALPKRIVMLSEIDDQDKLDKSVFKRMCGGDMIACRELYANEIVQRVPSFTVIIATNSNPTVKGADDALLRRLCVIPFENYVSKEDEIASKADVLRHAAGGVVFSWLVDGYKMYANEGLAYDTWPDQVKMVTEEFGSLLDEVGEFLADCTQMEKGIYTNTGDLYNAYKVWCGIQGIPEMKRMTKNSFGRQMTSKGYKRTRKVVNGNNTFKYVDLKLLTRTKMINVKHS